MNQTVGQAVAHRDNGPGALIERYKNDFRSVLPTHVKPDQWVRLSQGLLRRNQQLAKVAARNPGALLAALLDCARLGLEPGDTYHLVPFGDDIVGIPDYTGEIELIYRAGAVSSVKAEIVYSGDRFDYDPSMDRPDHKVDWFTDRGDMIGVYAYAVMKDGSTSRVVVMNKTQVEQVKAVSKAAKAADSPWQKWPDRMWLKTAVKQLAKWVPASAEYMREHLRASAEADAAARGQEHATAGPAPPEIYDAEVVDATTGEIHPEDEAARDEAAAEAAEDDQR